jgi:uncharacterized membrane protein
MNKQLAIMLQYLNWMLCVFFATTVMVIASCVQSARASDLIEGAKAIGGMGTTELLALIALGNAVALVAVVRVFVGRFLKSMDALTEEMRSKPCLYLKHHSNSKGE